MADLFFHPKSAKACLALLAFFRFQQCDPGIGFFLSLLQDHTDRRQRLLCQFWASVRRGSAFCQQIGKLVAGITAALSAILTAQLLPDAFTVCFQFFLLLPAGSSKHNY